MPGPIDSTCLPTIPLELILFRLESETQAGNRRRVGVCHGHIEESSAQRRCLELFERLADRVPHVFVHRRRERSEKAKPGSVGGDGEGSARSSGFSGVVLQEML